MNLFLTLKKKQRPTSFERSEEMAFFLANAGMLSDLQYFAPLMKAQSPFQVERANIVLRSLYAKQTIDKTLKSTFAKSEGLGEREKAILIEEAVAPVLKKLPYHRFEDQKIYLPFFSKSLNRIYGQEWEKLANKPYKRMAGNFEAVLIDPFDYYGDDLFDSLFTRLVRVKKDASGSAFYDYDSSSIYFVNKQGRLDAECCLFDRYLKDVNRNHMMERILPAVEAYYKNDREGMKKALVENKLISSRLIYKNNYDEVVLLSKIEKDASKL